MLWHCDHCFCICDEQGKLSDRFFSLRQAVSDIGNNMQVPKSLLVCNFLTFGLSGLLLEFAS